VWDLGTRTKVWRTHPLSHPASVAFSPDGSYIAVKNTSGTILLLDVATGAPSCNFANADDGEGSGLEFSSDGLEIVDGSWSGWLRVRQADSGAIVFAREYPGEMITAVHRTVDGTQWLVVHAMKVTTPNSAPQNGYCSVWRWPFRDGPLFEQPLSSESVRSTALSPDGKFLAFTHGRPPSRLSVIQLQDGLEIAAVEAGPKSSLGAVAWSPNMSRLASVHEDRVVQYTWPALKVLTEWQVPYAAQIAYAPGGGLLAIAAWHAGTVVEVQG